MDSPNLVDMKQLEKLFLLVQIYDLNDVIVIVGGGACTLPLYHSISLFGKSSYLMHVDFLISRGTYILIMHAYIHYIKVPNQK